MCYFLNIWFGKLPVYFGYFAKTCEFNPHRWLLFTDQVNAITPINPSLTLMPYTWESLIRDFDKLDIKIERPEESNRSQEKILAKCRLYLYYFIKDKLEDHTHWGIYDVDVLYGDLTDLKMGDYKAISGDPRRGCGPFMVFENSCLEKLLNYPRMNEISVPGTDFIETLEFAEYVGAKLDAELQPIHKIGYRNWVETTWNKGKLSVNGVPAGFFHFGGQRKRYELAIPPVTNAFGLNNQGFFNSIKFS